MNPANEAFPLHQLTDSGGIPERCGSVTPGEPDSSPPSTDADAPASFAPRFQVLTMSRCAWCKSFRTSDHLTRVSGIGLTCHACIDTFRHAAWEDHR